MTDRPPVPPGARPPPPGPPGPPPTSRPAPPVPPGAKPGPPGPPGPPPGTKPGPPVPPGDKPSPPVHSGAKPSPPGPPGSNPSPPAPPGSKPGPPVPPGDKPSPPVPPGSKPSPPVPPGDKPSPPVPPGSKPSPPVPPGDKPSPPVPPGDKPSPPVPPGSKPSPPVPPGDKPSPPVPPGSKPSPPVPPGSKPSPSVPPGDKPIPPVPPGSKPSPPVPPGSSVPVGTNSRPIDPPSGVASSSSSSDTTNPSVGKVRKWPPGDNSGQSSGPGTSSTISSSTRRKWPPEPISGKEDTSSVSNLPSAIQSGSTQGTSKPPEPKEPPPQKSSHISGGSSSSKLEGRVQPQRVAQQTDSDDWSQSSEEGTGDGSMMGTGAVVSGTELTGSKPDTLSIPLDNAMETTNPNEVSNTSSLSSGPHKESNVELEGIEEEKEHNESAAVTSGLDENTLQEECSEGETRSAQTHDSVSNVFTNDDLPPTHSREDAPDISQVQHVEPSRPSKDVGSVVSDDVSRSSSKLSRSQSMFPAPTRTPKKELKRHLSLTNIPPQMSSRFTDTSSGGFFSKGMITSGVLKRPKDPSAESVSTLLQQKESGSTDHRNKEGKTGLPADELSFYQLKGIFALYDEDKDGYITKAQLIKCLQLLGFQIREKLLLKYLNPPPEVSERATSESPSKSPRGKKGTSSPSKSRKSEVIKSNLTALASSRVGLSTFLKVTLQELPRLHESIEADLGSLFAFMDPAGAGTISIKDLRHLLVDTLSSTRLDGDEFTDVLEAAGIDIKGVQRERDHVLNYENFIDNLLIGRRWKEV